MIISRRVEFRYDLGSGLAVIKSNQPVTPLTWHKIQAKRWHKDGMLKLGNSEDVIGQSGGDLRSLDIDRESTFIGGIPLENEKNLKNVTRIAGNLGLKKAEGKSIDNSMI